MDDPFTTSGFSTGFDFGTDAGFVNAAAVLYENAPIPPATKAPTASPRPGSMMIMCLRVLAVELMARVPRTSFESVPGRPL
jgi:hypothetical protein